MAVVTSCLEYNMWAREPHAVEVARVVRGRQLVGITNEKAGLLGHLIVTTHAFLTFFLFIYGNTYSWAHD